MTTPTIKTALEGVTFTAAEPYRYGHCGAVHDFPDHVAMYAATWRRRTTLTCPCGAEVTLEAGAVLATCHPVHPGKRRTGRGQGYLRRDRRRRRTR